MINAAFKAKAIKVWSTHLWHDERWRLPVLVRSWRQQLKTRMIRWWEVTVVTGGRRRMMVVVMMMVVVVVFYHIH